MKKAVIVVYGKDTTGIIYNVTKVLYENNINILDIDQTTADGYFNMMTIVDISKVRNIDKVKEELEKVTKKMSLIANFQLEETFDAMHRV